MLFKQHIMKKITLLFFTFFTCIFSNAQQTISFEGAEGYTLGDINTQNGWIVTGCGTSCIKNQVVSDEMSTDGSYSFKIDRDPFFIVQGSPTMGGFYVYTVPIPYATAVFSADIYMSVLNTTSFRFGTFNVTAGSFTIILDFDKSGSTFVFDGGVFEDTGFSWSAMTWYNVRLETSGTTVKYFIDDVEIYEGALIVNEDIEEVRFAHDNGGGFAYMDNYRTNDELLSIDDKSLSNISVYPNPVKDNIKIDTILTIDDVTIVNLVGQKVLQFKSEHIVDNSVNLSALSTGLYFMNISSEGKSQSIKIIKE